MSTENNVVPQDWAQYETKQPMVTTPPMKFASIGDRIRGTFVKQQSVEIQGDNGMERKNIYTIVAKDGYYTEVLKDADGHYVKTGKIINLVEGEEYAVWGKPDQKSAIDREFTSPEYHIGDIVGVLYHALGEKKHKDKNAAKLMKCFNFGRDEAWHRAQTNGEFSKPAPQSAPVQQSAPAAPVQQQLTPDNFMDKNIGVSSEAAYTEDIPW